MNTSRGFGTAAIVALAAAIIVIGGVLYFNIRPEAEIMIDKGGDMVKEGDTLMQKGDTMMKKGDDMMHKGKDMMNGTTTSSGGYSGAVLAGTSAPLLDFNKADYDKALASGKLVVLYFYANWCPLCKAEFPEAQTAFNTLKTDAVVGFRVNYNDSDTDANEVALARQFGVAYQHTKVFLKNGVRLLKSPDTWNAARYMKEINTALSI